MRESPLPLCEASLPTRSSLKKEITQLQTDLKTALDIKDYKKAFDLKLAIDSKELALNAMPAATQIKADLQACEELLREALDDDDWPRVSELALDHTRLRQAWDVSGGEVSEEE